VTPTLWQLRLSHFNEKARWALDHKQVPHARRTSLPAFHAVRALRMTGRRTMPILVLDGQAIRNSDRIIAALEERHPDHTLYPEDPAERQRALELEQDFGEGLGPDVRRIFLFHWLGEDPQTLCRAYTKPVSSAYRRTYTAAFSLTQAVMRQAMNLRAPAAEGSTDGLRATLDRIGSELDGGDYLVGGRFSVADLSAASLLAPLLRPPEYQYDFPEPNAPSLEALRSELAEHRAWRWAQEMWSRHRGESAEVPA
jgi:glutathione S-transferase